MNTTQVSATRTPHIHESEAVGVGALPKTQLIPLGRPLEAVDPVGIAPSHDAAEATIVKERAANPGDARTKTLAVPLKQLAGLHGHNLKEANPDDPVLSTDYRGATSSAC